MSMELMVQAMKVKVGNPLRKLVLLKLADNASDQGECWPSYQHIADQCEISRRSVMNHINALCLSGLMIKETRTGPKGNTSNFYRLTLDGASNKQGIVQQIHQGGEGDSLGGATDSLGGGAGDSPRICHSFEPVKEPENTSCPDASLSDEKLTKAEFLTRHPEAVVFSLRKSQWGSQEDLTCAKWIWTRVLKLYEQADTLDGEPVRPKEPNWTAWANDIRLMRMLDGRTHKQICELFRRVQSDPFWIRQVKCPSKLREKWDDLVIRFCTGVNMPAWRDVNHIPEPDNTIPAGFRG
ncbi:helix-turn-helix domain-containing protein [Cronobacter sakazakii]|uniref:helix-turn-helix domain-containing protein n=1 Tax=Cronobacter sakazakii TaxID=28141 RepID=UPI0015D7B6F1|nr:helix-turn-helix domain-containing protein [Cronobacter sakazakii]ELY3602116.1 helix-turn-helix domain-containing protein [Cronobacter sakazakii]MDK1141586.1 helix-turn-helix domain-containing protein [Cronobacter sakazakii]QLJ48483.1 helix-turn-helix domain-containing protein [Cronobacter sakazakii]